MRDGLKSILSIPSVSNGVLKLDFSRADFLSVFEITELLFHVLSNHDFESYQVTGDNAVVGYLRRVNFFHTLERIKGLPPTPKSPYTGGQPKLIELDAYHYKPEFEVASKKLYTMFQEIGLSESTTPLLVASLSEVADNSFLHNLGKWPSKMGPLLVSLIQEYPKKRELSVSLCDFGVGFWNTLRANYPELKNEAAAVELAVQPRTTSRVGYKGGNGLYFLRKNIFNGLSGSLKIRSSDTLVQITADGKASLLASGLPFSFGANVEFGIKY